MAEGAKIRGLGGGAALALVMIGAAGVLLAIFSSGSGHLEAAAIALLASAVAFAAIANIVFRS